MGTCELPLTLLCPICVEPVPANQIGNEFNGHKYDDPDIDEAGFFAEVEKQRVCS